VAIDPVSAAAGGIPAHIQTRLAIKIIEANFIQWLFKAHAPHDVRILVVAYSADAG
jgi:hypothetical protein